MLSRMGAPIFHLAIFRSGACYRLVSFILVIVGLMICFDLLLLALLMRLARGSRWRWVSLAFFGAQMSGLLCLLGDRVFDTGWYLPAPALSAVFIWNFLGLIIFTPVGILAVVWLALRWIRRQFVPPVAFAAPPVESPVDAPGLTRRELLVGAATLTPPLFTLSLSAAGMSQMDDLRVRRFEIPLEDLPRDLDGITIAHLTDMHVGQFTTGRVLDKLVELTNGLRADLILQTGDLINDSLEVLPEAIAMLQRLDPRSGLWMVEGNHDLIEDGNEFHRQIRASGIGLLQSQTTTVQLRGHPVQIIGLPWVRRMRQGYDNALSAQADGLLQQREGDAFPILLSHHPHAFDAAAKASIPLTLAGHTHGGQFMLNERLGGGPALFRYWSGLYERARSRMVVSNGVGNWFPLRINAPAEIVHITLRRV